MCGPMLRDVWVQTATCASCYPTPPLPQNRTELGDRDSSHRQLVPILISASHGMTPEIISLCSLGGLFWSLPPYAAFVGTITTRSVFW